MSVAFDQHDGSIWMNGALVAWGDARVHVLTHGLHYASCVFEGARAYNGRVFKLREHTQRLFFSARELGFEIPYSMEEIDAACVKVLEVNKLSDGYLRPVAWRGSEMMGVSAQKNRINVAVAAWEWPSYFPMEERPERDSPRFGALSPPRARHRALPCQSSWALYDLHIVKT